MGVGEFVADDAKKIKKKNLGDKAPTFKSDLEQHKYGKANSSTLGYAQNPIHDICLAEEEENRLIKTARTQHPQNIPQQRPGIIVLDHHLKQPQLQNIVFASQMLGDLAQSVELSYRHVWRQPLLVRAF